MPEDNVHNNHDSAAGQTTAAGADERGSGDDAGKEVKAAGQLQERIALLESDLTAKEQELTQQKNLIQEYESRQESLNARHKTAVDAYRNLVLKANPLVPVELISGATVEEIDESLGRAVDLVGHIRQGLEQRQKREDQADAVPAGAPGRTPPDLNGMTAREKINYGLSQARQNR